jgi:hypothetical protein
MQFTKEYIELAKNEMIQKLRPEYQHGDWLIGESYGKPLIFLADELVKITSPKVEFKKLKTWWLPIGDNLDKEIIKICKERSKNGEDLSYDFGVSFSGGCISQYEADISDRDCRLQELNDNPLIAKILLLIKLLKEEK